MPQTTVISFFKYQGLKNKWNALGRMGRSPLLETEIEGLTFWKGLGSGSGNGFSIWPDFSTFGLLTVFDCEDAARKFLNSSVIEQYTSTCHTYSAILMHTIKSHGEWSKQSPFVPSVSFDKNKPLAVITRATIKPKLAHKFWRHVPSVSKSMIGFDGLVFSKGIGEWPILMQATYSLWCNSSAMMSYAYDNEKHAAMVKKTRELNWYAEELFARFHPFEIQGDLIKADQLFF